MYSVPVGACVSSVAPWFSMCSLQISVLFVLMRVEISLFSSGMLGSCGVRSLFGMQTVVSGVLCEFTQCLFNSALYI